MRNVQLALRTLTRTPFVTTVAVLSLALGIGANAAIYSLFDRILLQPLPVQQPDRLVNLAAPGPKPGSQSCNQAGDCDVVLSYPMLRDLEQAGSAFSGVAGHRTFGANIAYPGGTMNAEGVMVSGSYFDVLGLRPVLGRLIGRADDVTVGAHPVAVLSHHFWQMRMGSDPAVVGKTITINGHPLEILGVAPAGFSGTTLGTRPVVYVPITMRGQMNPGFKGFDNRQSYWLYGFARLQPGATLESADEAVNAVYHAIVNDVEAPLQKGMSDQTMAQFRGKRLLLEDGRRGQSTTHEEAKIPLLLLFATTGIVLVIACANIANLLLARGANRAMEMAVRLSLGARRRQVIAQLLTEALVLALLGGIVSLLVAHWTLQGIGALLSEEAVETLGLGLQPSVVLFTGALAIGTGVLFGLVPALQSTRPDLLSTIRANAGNLTLTRGALRFRSGLVISQIALSMALLIAAGLFLKSLANISRVDLGVKVDDIITFGVSPELNAYSPARSRALFESIEQELGAVPGVTAVTSSLVPLIAGSNWGTDVQVQGFESGPDIDSNARFNYVGPGYFGTVGIPVLRGREFAAADNTTGEKVAVVNEAFVRKFGLGADAVGRYMSDSGPEDMNIHIIGVVRNAAYSSVKDEIPPLFFRPWRQDTMVGSMYFYVRSSLPAEQTVQAVRSVMTRLDPNLPLEDLKSMPQQIRENVSQDRMISILAASFAALATLLAGVGLYGVLAYTVATRTREIGVRMALGASAASVRRMVLGQVGRMLVIGGVLGVAGAWFIGRAAASILFNMSGTDAGVFAAAIGVLVLFALAAGYLPALRASRVQPVRALRYE